MQAYDIDRKRLLICLHLVYCLFEMSERYILLIEPEDALHSQVTIYIAG